MNILVTGGAGFIGSHVVTEALHRGHSITVIDNLSSGKLENLPSGINFVKEDIRYCNWDCHLKDIDIVVHCAAFVSAPESFKYFNDCYDINVIGFWRLINACVKNNINKIIFCSSSAVYAEEPLIPKNESDLPNPTTPYGLSKLDGEHILAMARNSFSLNYSALRFFNVFGPRQDLNSDYSAVIPIFINKSLQNLDFVIYGTGKQRRDFVFVSDVANAILNFAFSDVYGIFNVGTGKDYSLLELSEIIINETNSKSRLRFEQARPGDVMYSTASLAKQKQIGLWKPNTGFIEGIEKTINFYSKNMVPQQVQ